MSMPIQVSCYIGVSDYINMQLLFSHDWNYSFNLKVSVMTTHPDICIEEMLHILQLASK